MENVCPYGDNCPQVVSVTSDVKLLSNKIDTNQAFLVEKVSDISSDIKDLREFLTKDLNAYIDERIENALNKQKAATFKWVITSLLGSGGLSAIITLLLNK